MATKTVLLRAALLSRGFKPVDHVSSKECLAGNDTQGRPIWIWLDKVGGGRYARSAKKGEAQALSAATVERVITGKPSSLIPGGV